MIRKFLDCSTANLTPETMAPIEAGQVGGSNTLLVEYGALVYASAHDRTTALPPPDLEAAFAEARKQGCDYVLFDRDGEIHPQLHDYSEEWA